MPTYEYACTQCGRRIEVVQSFSDSPLEVCDECGGKLRRVFHPVGVLFKGSGFYSTEARAGRGASGRSREGEKAEAKSGSSNKEGASGSGDKEGTSDSSPNKKGDASAKAAAPSKD
jgi:putative FmdB family regulatory protein